MNYRIIHIFIILSIIIPSASAVSPDHPVYRITIIINDLQELLVFNNTQQVILKQQHLESYLKDLNFSNNNAYIIEKIKTKQKEVDDMIPQLNSEHIRNIKHNQEILYNLLNSSTMPLQSKKGLQNAYNNSMTNIITKIDNHKNIRKNT